MRTYNAKQSKTAVCGCLFFIWMFVIFEIQSNFFSEGNSIFNSKILSKQPTSFNSISKYIKYIWDEYAYEERQCNFTHANECTWPIFLWPSEAKFLKEIDLSKFNILEKEYLESRIPIYQERAKNVAKFCLKHPEKLLGEERIFLWNYHKRNPPVAYCIIQKIASTTWVTNFLLLADFNINITASNEVSPHGQYARFNPKNGWNHHTAYYKFQPPKSMDERAKLFRDSIRFLVVRHPFTRILSAFRVKMLMHHPNLDDDWKYNMIRQEVIRKYRLDNSSNTSEFPSFSEFVDYLIDNLDILRRNERWMIPFPLTFHKQSDSCNVCGSDYNLIMKLETLEEDEQFLAILTDMKQVKTKVKLPKYIKRIQNNVNSYEASPSFYKTLSRSQIMGLYELFKDDFELFDYNIDEYLGYAGS